MESRESAEHVEHERAKNEREPKSKSITFKIFVVESVVVVVVVVVVAYSLPRLFLFFRFSPQTFAPCSIPPSYYRSARRSVPSGAF